MDNDNIDDFTIHFHESGVRREMLVLGQLAPTIFLIV